MTTYMKAAVYHGVEDIRIERIPVPQIGPNELLVRTTACAICGTDVRIFYYGHHRVSPPRVLGHETAGEIATVGKLVEGFEIGERVVLGSIVPCRECYWCLRGIHNLCDNIKVIAYDWDGGFAEYVRVPEGLIRCGGVVKISEGMLCEEVSIAEPLSCCINGQELAEVRLGEDIAIIGAGPIGCMHSQLAKAIGAKVMIIDLEESRLKRVKTFGVDAVINSRKEDPVERVLEETGGKGADVVIVACSSATAQRQSLKMGAKRARIVFFGGLPHGKSIANLDTNIIHYKEQYVIGCFGSTPYQFKKAVELITKGIVNAKLIVTKTFTLDDILDGIRYTEEKNGLKAVVKP